MKVLYKKLNNCYRTLSPNLNLLDIIDVLEQSSQHMYNIYLSMITNTLALKQKKAPDCLIYKDKYASHVAITTLSHMTNVLNSMEMALHTQIKVRFYCVKSFRLIKFYPKGAHILTAIHS